MDALDDRLVVYLHALRLHLPPGTADDGGAFRPAAPLAPLLGTLRPPRDGLTADGAWSGGTYALRPVPGWAALVALLPDDHGVCAAMLAVACTLRHGERDVDRVVRRLTAVLRGLGPLGAFRRSLRSVCRAIHRAPPGPERHAALGLLRSGDACGARLGRAGGYCEAVPCLGSALCWRHRVLILAPVPPPPLGHPDLHGEWA